MQTRERRSYALELREVAPDAAGKLAGYAAVFGSRSYPMSDFQEVVSPGAFSRALAQTDHDILAVWCHDMSRPLASRDAGTLTLSEDDHGLAFEMSVPGDTTWEKDALAACKKKLVRKMSIGFEVRGQAWSQQDGVYVRTINDVDLFEISPVPFPAYEETEVEARAGGEALRTFLATEGARSKAAITAAARFKFARARNTNKGRNR